MGLTSHELKDFIFLLISIFVLTNQLDINL